MSDFVRMDHVPIQSASAAASLGMGDANYDSAKHHDSNKITLSNHLMTWLLGVVALSSIGTGLLAMWMEASLVVYIAFLFPLITGPMVLIQRRKLQWLPTFQEEENKLRMQVNELAAKRVQLGIEVKRMSRQIQRMCDVTERFEYLCQREGQDATYFQNLIKENAKIQSEIKKSQASRDVMDLMAMILSSDRNGDRIVSPKEAEQFIHKLKAYAGRNSRFLNEDMVREAFLKSMNNPATSYHPTSMLNIVQSAMSDEEGNNVANGAEGVGGNQSSSHYRPSEEVVDNDFVRLSKVPRVAPTGLVLRSYMDEEEGNLAHPIRVEDLMRDRFDEWGIESSGREETDAARDPTRR